jgi:RNA polymerase sigma factor (sigma-70 family)
VAIGFLPQRQSRMHHHPTCEETHERLLITIAALARKRARALLSTDMADDVAQDVVLECLLKVREGDSIDEKLLGGLVRQMVRRRVSDLYRGALRSGERNARHVRAQMAEVHAWMHPDLALEEGQLDEMRTSILDGLPTGCRRAFVMVREEELAYSAVASKLGVTRSAVHCHVVEAQRRFRRQLHACGISVPPPNAQRASTKGRRRVTEDRR